jgi:DNA-binding NarL/FixJ family response regulator
VLKTVAFLGQSRALAETLKTEFQRSRSFTFSGSWTSLHELFGNGVRDLPRVLLLGATGADEENLEPLLTLKRLWPRVAVVVLAQNLDISTFLRAFQLGADGCLILPFNRNILETVLQNAFDGGRSFCTKTQKLLLDHLARVASPTNTENALTPAEHRILNHLIWNLSDKEIATATGHATTTIHSITAHIYKKLGVHSRREAVRTYFGFSKPKLSRRSNRIGGNGNIMSKVESKS